MIQGEGEAFVPGVTAQEAFDFVLDPAQYTKADTKIVWVTKLADTPDGMIAREDGKFMGRFRGSVVTRYRWEPPNHIDVQLEHGLPEQLHAWFEIEDRDGGMHLRHVETMHFGHGVLGVLYDAMARRWFERAVSTGGGRDRPSAPGWRAGTGARRALAGSPGYLDRGLAVASHPAWGMLVGCRES